MHSSLRGGFATSSRRCLSSWPFSQALQVTPDRTSNPVSDRLDESGTIGRHSDAKIALAENGPLFNKLRNQFESKLLHKGDTDIAWSDYSRLLDSMLDKVSVSIVSHHFLFKSICSTPTTQSTDLESKTHLLNKIVLQLGRDARMDEYVRLASLPAWALMEMIATVLIRAGEYSVARDVLKDAIAVDSLRVWALLDAFTGAAVANSKASVNDAGLLVRLAVESLVPRASEGNDLVGRINQIAVDACFAALISASGTGEEADAMFQDFERVVEVAQTLNWQCGQTFAFLDSLDSSKWKVSVRGLISVSVKMRNGELEALLDKLKNGGWKHRRVLVIVKTVADSIDGVETRVPSVHDASWSDNGVTEEEIHRMHDFAIGAGRGVMLS
ncbi:hypothetical protein HDU80_008599 [Chytriomyces hyalinus]|nr:hypothetical protein HDU80_008599 [Chytriomyces hyalinus]